MKKFTLHHLCKEEITVLQDTLFSYQNSQEMRMKTAQNFYDSILLMDISFTLWLTFRSRLEKEQPKKGHRLTIRASEAVVLLKVCNSDINNDNIYCKNVKLKIASSLDQQLKSLV